MDSIIKDLHYAARGLWKRPGFTAIAVLTLALGIGANTAIFSVVNATLMRLPPVSDPDRLVFVFNGPAGSIFSYPDYAALRDQNNVFDGLVAWGGITASINSNDQTDQVSGAIVSGNFFDVIGVPAQLGRVISTADDKTPGAHPVVVISQGLWQKRFGGDRNVVGRQLLLNGNTFTIIGVLPAGFDGLQMGAIRDLYVPLTMQATMRPPRAGYSGEMNPDLLQVRDKKHFPSEDVLGRRLSLSGPEGPWREIVGVVRTSKYLSLGEAPTPVTYLPLQQNHETGMTLHVRTTVDPSTVAGAIRNETQSLERNLPLAIPERMSDRVANSLYAARTGAILLAVFGGLALLLASIGLYGVMAFAVSRRTRELGIRVALGARPGDVFSLVLRQGMTLVIAGLVLGLVVAAIVTRLLASFLYGVSTTDRFTFIAIPVLLTLVALLACYLPARRATKVDPLRALRYEQHHADCPMPISGYFAPEEQHVYSKSKRAELRSVRSAMFSETFRSAGARR